MAPSSVFFEVPNGTVFALQLYDSSVTTKPCIKASKWLITHNMYWLVVWNMWFGTTWSNMTLIYFNQAKWWICNDDLFPIFSSEWWEVPSGYLTVCHRKSFFLIGKPSINGSFSMAMFNNQRAHRYVFIYMYILYTQTIEVYRQYITGP